MGTFKFLMIKLMALLFGVCVCNNSTGQKTEMFEKKLKDSWAILSSEKTEATGEKISQVGFDVLGWYSAEMPSTVMAALVANNQYPDVFMGNNIDKIDTSIFRVPWWYRTEFNIDDTTKTIELIFEGINYRANIWLNGKQIATSDSIYGAFRIFKVNVSKNILHGKNALAIEVYHHKTEEPSIGFVDWSPNPPDRNMGIWRPVKIRISDKMLLDNTFIVSKINKNNYTEAELQISTEAINNSSETLNAVIKGRIENINFEKKITLKPNEKQFVIFTSNEFPQLKMKNPRLWWTYDLGTPEMYELVMNIGTWNDISYSKTTRFGIREVEDYINAQGHRGYKLNGVELLIKGGGWVDGMFLNDTEEKVKAQFEYVKHANMNTIRLEGIWGNSERFYELADEMGLLLMVGWSCQWEWSLYLAKPEDDFVSFKTPEDIRLILNYAHDQICWLRNHPSIFVWVLGSDKLPRPELEEKYYSLLKKIDYSRPLLMSCKGLTSSISGNTGVKMNGPYEYVAPSYWYVDSLNGGAFGFNTETGPGPQVPSLEILQSMIPKEKLWPINDMWNFHCGRYEFQTLNRYLNAFNMRYGEQNNVENFTFKSQASNLEAMRAMYEAFAINRVKTTGIIQWMYNSAWPKLIWQFWDYNLMPNAAFYGARIGARPVNIAYNYGNNSVYVTNLNPNAINGLKADIKIYDLNGKVIDETVLNASVNANSSQLIYALPTNIPFTNVYFLYLKITDDAGKKVADNFYWLSIRKDINDFEKTEWFYTPLAEYADFTDLNKLPKIKIEVNQNIKNIDGAYEVTVKLNNPTDKIAFLIEMDIAGDKTGKSVVPILWDENYISLLPHEAREVKAKFNASALKGEQPVFSYKGWNIKN